MNFTQALRELIVMDRSCPQNLIFLWSHIALQTGHEPAYLGLFFEIGAIASR